MKTLFAFITTILCLAACHTAPTLAPSPALSGNYVLDPAHASVTWSVSHAGLSHYTARFETIEGALRYDALAPEASRVDIRINPVSVSTGLPDFDDTIANDSRYFDAKTYPKIRFVSTEVQALSENAGTVTGELTFRGQTHPLTLDVTYNGVGKSFGHPGDTLGFSATGELSRTQYGLTYLKNFGIGDTVTLRIEAEFNEK